ncbi:RHS repeat-associated core domain-containing protein [Actinomadura sp. 6N118]|uniref:RHS repeat-associated core domain-containing protein n=1 Tax=Actinomadura sp. 6N118 TaxID=3375151 RepID=UPI0037A96362
MDEKNAGGETTHRWWEDPQGNLGSALADTSKTGELTWLLDDPQGTISDTAALSGSDIALTGSADFDPFGEDKGATGTYTANPLRFHGQYLDSVTGLYDVRARDYDAATGRFSGTDPVKQDPGSAFVQTYHYGNNNPLGYTDASGENAAVVAGILIGRIALPRIVQWLIRWTGKDLMQALIAVFGAGTVAAGLKMISGDKGGDSLAEAAGRAEAVRGRPVRRAALVETEREPQVGAAAAEAARRARLEALRERARARARKEWRKGDKENLPKCKPEKGSKWNRDWRSGPAFGHAFTRHGSGRKIGQKLIDRARCEGATGSMAR